MFREKIIKTIKVNNWSDIPKNFTGIAEFPDGAKEWYQNRVRHREVGPCTSCKDCLKGNFKLCSKPGPAAEWCNGIKEWYQKGKLHREDGPAIEWSDGYRQWFINGERISEISFKVFQLCLEKK